MNSEPGPFDVAACTCAGLRRAARAVTQIYDAALRPAGLTANQFTLLATLERAGDAPLTRLAEILVMERTTLTRNLRPLERRGLVAVLRERDRRVRRVTLTAAGRRLLEEARPRWARAQSQVVDELGAEGCSGLRRDLDHLVDLFAGR